MQFSILVMAIWMCFAWDQNVKRFHAAYSCETIPHNKEQWKRPYFHSFFTTLFLPLVTINLVYHARTVEHGPKIYDFSSKSGILVTLWKKRAKYKRLTVFHASVPYQTNGADLQYTWLRRYVYVETRVYITRVYITKQTHSTKAEVGTGLRSFCHRNFTRRYEDRHRAPCGSRRNMCSLFSIVIRI